MAAPQWQLITLPLGRGLAQDQESRLVTPGSMGEAHNVIVDRAGRYTKRAGWGRLPRTAEDGPNVPPPDRVDTAGAELLQVDATNGELWSWGPGRGRWERVGSLPEFRVERRPLLRTVATLFGGGIIHFGTSSKYERIWWQHLASGGGSFDVWEQVRDAETGALIARDAQVFSPTRLTYCVGVSVGATSWIVYAGGDVRISAYDGSLGASDFAVGGTSVTAFDACSHLTSPTPLGAIAWAESSSPDIEVLLSEEDGGYYASATITAPDDVNEVAICLGTGGDLWVAAILDPGVGSYDIMAWRLDASLSVIAGPLTIENRITNPGDLQIALNESGDCYVTFGGQVDTSDPNDSLFVRAIFAASNTVSAWRKEMWRSYPGGAPVLGANGLYLPVLCDAVGTSTNDDANHLCLVRIDASFNSNPPVYSGLIVHQTAALPTLRQRWIDGSKCAVIVKTTEQPEAIDNYGLDRIELDISGRRTAPSLHLAQQAPVWGLCDLWGYDSYDAADVMILQPPELKFDAGSGITPGPGTYFDEGDFVYIARYERIDDQGVMHVSPWSSPLVVSVAATTAIALDIQIRNTLLTQHGRRGSYRALSVALYRTAVDGAAAGVIRYYRLTGYGIDSLRFDTTDERITYTDDDADPTGLGLGVWTTAGRLPPLAPPPPRDLLACKGRLWVVPADQTRQVWFSQQILADEIPWFHSGLSVQLLDTEEQIEAIASLDDRVVIFTKTRIYVVEGDGPLDTGAGSFVGPNLISSAFGCIERRSVISTSRGVYFLAACGLCLLDRGLSVQVVGDPVRDLIESGTIEGVVYDEAGARVIWHRRYGEGVSSLVLYDERHAVWTTADSNELDAIRSLCWDRSRSALILAYTFGICQEGYGAAPGFDGNPDDPTWFATTLATPWVRAGAPGSWMQAELVHLEGEVQGPSKTLVRWYRDYSATADGSVEIDATLAMRGDRLVYQVGAKSQTCSAVKITVIESAPASVSVDPGAPGGIRWWGMTLKASVQPGEARIAPGLRGGVA